MSPFAVDKGLRAIAGELASVTRLRSGDYLIQAKTAKQSETLLAATNLLDVPVVCPKIAETTALGAAYAAGLAVGFWETLDELLTNWQVERRWVPQMDSTTRTTLYNSWKKAVTRTFNWVE